jgi:C-terminal processing protease CtpA/Prc
MDSFWSIAASHKIHSFGCFGFLSLILALGQREGIGTQAQRQEATPTQGEARPPAKEPVSQDRDVSWGLEFADLNSTVVTAVKPSSVAANVGVQVGDKIVGVSGRRISSGQDLKAIMERPPRRIEFLVSRDGREQVIAAPPSSSESQREKAWLGVYLEDSEFKEGAKLVHVYPAGPAARAGLQAGDIVTRVNDEQIDTASQLAAAVDKLDPSKPVKLAIKRGATDREMTISLGKRRQYYDDDADFSEDGDDPFSQVSHDSMRLEHDRRMAEQHQRIEEELQKLREEVRLLRELIQKQRQ